MRTPFDPTWTGPMRWRSAFSWHFSRAAILDPALVTQLSAVAGLRNRIAHGYTAVDIGRLWRELPMGLDALDAFCVALATHLEH